MTEEQTRPLVTAIITAYNRPKHLRSAVQSVLKQTYDNIELVVVDDHSDIPAENVLIDTDVSALSNYNVVRHDTNRGANAARNTGIGAASGEYLAFLDDDDEWLPKKLERQIKAFKTTENIGLVYTGIKWSLPDDVEIEIPPTVDGDMTKALLCRNVVGSMSVVMVRADIAQSISLDERFPCWADLEWFVNLSQETKFKRIPEPLVVYNCDSPNRLSRNFEKANAGRQLFVEKFEPLAAEYGTLFQRKMRGWAAYRAGKSAFHNGLYEQSRQLFVSAIISHPFEPMFGTYLFASLGGRKTHKMARIVNRQRS